MDFLKKYGLKTVTYTTLILFGIIIAVPLLWVIISSLKTTGEILASPFSLPKTLNFQNYADAWTSAKMGEYFLNSVIVTVFSLILLVFLAVPCSYVLSRFKFFGVKLISLIFMAGLFVNVNYIVTPLYIMTVGISRALGLGVLLADNLVTVIIIYAVTNLAFSIYLLTGYFVSLPKGYEEAAKIDGCGYTATLFRISMPLALPSIITVILFSFLAFWNEYIVAQWFLSSTSTLPVGLLNITVSSKFDTNLGRMYAGLMIVMLPILLLYIFVQGQLTKGLSLGGIKG